MILNNLQPASFRGAQFYVTSASTDGGRKVVTHEYPNTAMRTYEDLGQLQKTFSVEGIINGEGDAYFAMRDALLAALETKGSGPLVHPFFGNVTVVAKPYKLSENVGTLGLATISMNFETVNATVYPASTGSDLSAVVTKGQAVADAAGASISGNFTVPKLLSNITAAANKLTAIASSIQSAASQVNAYSGEVATVSASITAFKDSVKSMTQTPAIMAANITGAFDSLLSLAQTPAQALAMMTSLFGFGADDAAIAATTAPLAERAANNTLLNNSVNALALGVAYSVVPTQTFTTVEDIQKLQQTLDAQYNALPATLDPDVRSALANARDEVCAFLETASLTAWNVAQITAPDIPATVLAYMYYADVTEADTLISLNNTAEPTFMNGAVDILSS
jgi:prophage DNA circulation protein